MKHLASHSFQKNRSASTVPGDGTAMPDCRPVSTRVT